MTGNLLTNDKAKDTDREAFEKWAISYDCPIECWNKEIGNYADHDTFYAAKGWQAARDHYAHKLTEMQAVTVMKNAIFNTWHTGGIRDVKHVALIAVKALAAAGVKFKPDSTKDIAYEK